MPAQSLPLIFDKERNDTCEVNSFFLAVGKPSRTLAVHDGLALVRNAM
jgi:hypothetical protein